MHSVGLIEIFFGQPWANRARLKYAKFLRENGFGFYLYGPKVPPGIEILWTGPKVISDEISPAHLKEVTQLLKRKPFICDNIFANDGPKNCKFIKLKNPPGLCAQSLEHASHWAFNPMNQPELSKIALLAVQSALLSPSFGQNHLQVAEASCSKEFAAWLQHYESHLLTVGLDGISETERKQMAEQLDGVADPAATELKYWLDGRYTVGNECLTD